MAQVRVELSGHERLIRLLAKARADVKQVAGRALYEEASVIFEESQRLVPVDTGSLRSSGHVTNPMPSASGITVEISYGGAAAPYALYVHERMDTFHPIGQAKYLEEPVLDAQDDIVNRITDAIERLVESA